MTEDALDYSYETKAIDPHATEFHEAIMRGFEVYREENDRRISRLEKAKSSDVIVEEKLARIDQFMDETQKRIADLQLKSRRPLLGGEDKSHEGGGELHRKAFDAYVRGGETTTLKTLESKALSAGSGPDGGFLVPLPQEREILRRMAIISPIRSLASVQSISTATFKKAYSTTGPQSGWVSETSARTQTNSQQIAELSFPAMELYAMPSATQTILDDAAVNVEEWISSEVETVFAEQEGASFVSGDGVSKPLGFTTPVKVPQSTWAWGKLGYVATGAAGNFAASAPSDALIDLVYAVKAGYRQNATFVMNRKTQAAVRKLKMTTGEYLWQPPLTAGGRASLMTFPLVEAEDMPDIVADSTPIAFGDFARGYLIVDRVGVRVLRDPYSAKPYVLFYTTKRVGGGVQDFDAIKFLKFGTA
ncbi:MAG: phage major capsid protein [Alphaproteobacteria bacterium]